MDPTRGRFERQKSLNSPGEIPSPTMLLLHRHACLSSFGLSNVKKPLNLQVKAAAQRLAQVMAYQPLTMKMTMKMISHWKPEGQLDLILPLSTDLGSMNSRESNEHSAQLSSTALQVELDMLQ
ncbi:hypothetical protein Nepgr_009618 [Nepenthes gracilis]|uniref:Uncharacterized protein n=1 Tax=Nepenthes gracilis TaxID=150966 RepID=A0AAD3SAU4_NEPGR|nr:hypothetical protein Nepgr_009618 [Nepenthes gracilis]